MAIETRICEYCQKEFTRYFKRNGVGRFCSRTCMGKTYWSKGHAPWNKNKKTGIKPPNFKEVGVSYSGIHHWINSHKGKAKKCTNCGLDKIPRGLKRYFEWANVSGEYKRDVDDWVELCVSCHRLIDNTARKAWITRKLLGI